MWSLVNGLLNSSPEIASLTKRLTGQHKDYKGGDCWSCEIAFVAAKIIAIKMPWVGNCGSDRMPGTPWGDWRPDIPLNQVPLTNGMKRSETILFSNNNNDWPLWIKVNWPTPSFLCWVVKKKVEDLLRQLTQFKWRHREGSHWPACEWHSHWNKWWFIALNLNLSQ